MVETQVNNNTGLYFIVGGLVVAVIIAAFAYFNGYVGDYTKTTTTEQTTTTPAPAVGTTTTAPATGNTTTTTTTTQ